MATKTEATEQIVVTQITNTRSITVLFHLEPWGDEYKMPPGATFDLMAKGPEGASLQIEVADDSITVWGWEGSVAHLFHEGEELGAGLWERQAVPPTPRRAVE